MNDDDGFDYQKRFRADPALVRVSIRNTAEGWVVRIAPRRKNDTFFASARNADPEKAVYDALVLANAYRFPGMNLGLDDAHTHPWGAIAYALQGEDPRERTTRHKR